MPKEQQTPQNIKWNEVTWYSRLSSIVLFFGIVPALCFYIGDQYQETMDVLLKPVVVIYPSQQRASTSPVTATPANDYNSTAQPGVKK